MLTPQRVSYCSNPSSTPILTLPNLNPHQGLGLEGKGIGHDEIIPRLPPLITSFMTYLSILYLLPQFSFSCFESLYILLECSFK